MILYERSWPCFVLGCHRLSVSCTNQTSFSWGMDGVGGGDSLSTVVTQICVLFSKNCLCMLKFVVVNGGVIWTKWARQCNYGTDSGVRRCNYGTSSGARQCNYGTDSGARQCNYGTDSGARQCNYGTVLVTFAALCWLDHTDRGPHRQNVHSFAAKMRWCKEPGSIWMAYLLRMKRVFAMCLWLCQSPLLIIVFLLVALLYCLQDYDIKNFLNILGKHADEWQ